MKLKPVVLAMAASGLMAGQAYALPVGTVTDINLYVSGATAQDKAFVGIFKDTYCKKDVSGNAVDFDAYVDVQSPLNASGKNQRAFSCTLAASVLGVEKTITVHKESLVGSGHGVQPVANAAALSYMNVATKSGSVGCEPAALAAGDTPSGFPVGHTYSCSYTKSSDDHTHAPDAGLSDVEPGLFVGANVPATFTDVTADEIAKLDVHSVRVGVFGTPVSLNLRNALQAAQGLTVGADDEANMPSLNRQEIASLMASGGTKLWSSLKFNGNSLTTYNTANANPLLDQSYGASSQVTICRRVNGSGTQAQFNANFLGYPCVDNAPLPENTTYGSGPKVILNSSSGAVESCFDNAVNGVAMDVGTGTPTVVSKWAIGVQSTEKNSDKAKKYRFIKVDGAAPTNKNVWNNSYLDWVEESMQWQAVGQANAPTGDKLIVLEKMVADVGTPAQTKASSKNHDFGWTGYLTVPGTSATLATWDDLNPINSTTRGTPVNNCRVPLRKTMLPN